MPLMEYLGKKMYKHVQVRWRPLLSIDAAVLDVDRLPIWRPIYVNVYSSPGTTPPIIIKPTFFPRLNI